jgi:DNA-binding GntR family transcriptional regulator
MGGIATSAGISRNTAVEGLTSALRGRILDGDLPPGSRLVEREITEAHRASRPTVRSALHNLAAEGLVTLEAHRGASVAAFTPRTLEELFELRTALEVEATRIALQRDPQGLHTSLTEAVEELAALCRRPRAPWKRITEAHNRVHETIAASAGNARMHAAHEALAGELRLFMLHLKPVWTREEIARHHEELPGEIRELGETAVRRHLEAGQRAVLGAI